ncbi:MAG TPA: phosphoribosylformylglycinamidine synthase subunit PurL [Acidobacteriaceae bacterium]|jgi:phosphoribosylformylglycinamidine synthase|nr:phosphoribosylformylglycinamidine synthase subunit PurL [Acidobacteriaceae bacterium]
MKSSAAVAPPSATITLELLAQHGITADEYRRIEGALGRTPSLTELGIYSVMWSEHCSYKSSKVHLRRLPTRSKLVVQGPGENAGIIDVGDGWACAFKIESHNHPSYIEPFQGAATGVGGILRDIFTMGARPLAVMDSLRFGPLTADAQTPEALVRKNHSVVEGVVHGIAGYGNCFGVPNLGGETKFEPCYSGNPLVNAFALGLVRRDEIFYAKATGIGNPVIYVGARTGRDGIHGATMASEEFKEGAEQKRPNVQVGDPFMEKLLLEACLEAMQTGAVVGIQDMGAAGLTSSSCEMGGRGGVGIEMDLDAVPQRETGMTAYEMMLSESQERMLLVAEKGREAEVLRVFEKWGLEGVIVGTVIEEPRLRVLHQGEVLADIPNRSLTDECPLYERPVGEWARPEQIKVPLDPPAHVLAELNKPRDYTADLKKLLASANICSKRWVYEQYDSMVQTNTVQGPGGEAGVLRIKGTGTPGADGSRHERGLAMALAGNGRWCYLDPKLGAMHAVAEAARKVACTGATPVAATNCLNFGNPEKPEIMAQLSAAIDGIAEACTALGTPITGGNVSLYNETRGEGIYPTPVVGVVGIIEDVTKAVPAGISNEDKLVVLLGSPSSKDADDLQQELGSSEFAKVVIRELWGRPPRLDLEREKTLQKFLREIAQAGLIDSAQDVGAGGIAVALAKACMQLNAGIDANLSGLKWSGQGPSDTPDTPSDGILVESALFGEHSSMVLVSGSVRNIGAVIQLAQKAGIPTNPCGTIDDRLSGRLTISNKNPWSESLEGYSAIDLALSELKESFSTSLESQLAEEVTA